MLASALRLGSPGAAPTPLLRLLLAATYPTSPPWIPYGIIGLGGPSGSHVGPTRVPGGGYARGTDILDRIPAESYGELQMLAGAPKSDLREPYDADGMKGDY